MVASWLFDELLFISKWGGHWEAVLGVATQQLLLPDQFGNQAEEFTSSFIGQTSLVTCFTYPIITT